MSSAQLVDRMPAGVGQKKMWELVCESIEVIQAKLRNAHTYLVWTHTITTLMTLVRILPHADISAEEAHEIARRLAGLPADMKDTFVDERILREQVQGILDELASRRPDEEREWSQALQQGDIYRDDFGGLHRVFLINDQKWTLSIESGVAAVPHRLQLHKRVKRLIRR